MRQDNPGTVTVLGSINMDTVLQVTRQPMPGETIIATAVARHPGGKGANQAVAAARAGAAVRMIGAVGDDADGRAMLALMTDAGIDTAGVHVDETLPTGAAFITVDARGENQIVVLAGANAAARSSPAVAGVRLAQLELPVGTVSAFLTAPREGTITILNAAPFRSEAKPLLTAADILLLNETELAGYSGAAAPAASSADTAAMAEALRRRATQTVIVTLGAAGSIAVGPGGLLSTPSKAGEVVDTTGAGDCFCGYLAAGLAAGMALESAIADAHAAAAFSVGRCGAASSIPYRRELGTGAPS